METGIPGFTYSVHSVLNFVLVYVFPQFYFVFLNTGGHPPTHHPGRQSDLTKLATPSGVSSTSLMGLLDYALVNVTESADSCGLDILVGMGVLAGRP